MEPQGNDVLFSSRVKEVQEKEKKRTRRGGVTMALASLALVLSIGSGTLSTIMFLERGDGRSWTEADRNNEKDGNSVNFTEGSVADVANRVSPAVVSILTTTEGRGFFGQSQASSGAGTGMIVTKDGYVLTNKHVIEGASEVTVVTDDGEMYEDVEVVGVDPMNDVAYLKIETKDDLPVVTLGDSKTITVGQQVIAVGNALGQYANTITAGIVSATGRTITAGDSGGGNVSTLNDMVQTDAAINLGNSGGPLVNAAGEVIGINTAVSSSGEGLGFAVPISSMKGMLARIIETGKAERAYIGVSYLTITAEVARKYDLDVTSGAFVYVEGSGSAVVKDGPADKAGVGDEDIILAVNGSRVGRQGSVTSLIGEFAVGEMVDLRILRNGKEITVAVKLGAYNS